MTKSEWEIRARKMEEATVTLFYDDEEDKEVYTCDFCGGSGKERHDAHMDKDCPFYVPRAGGGMIIEYSPDVPSARQRSMGQRGIGYWKGEHAQELPDPHDFIDKDWDSEEKEAVVSYLLRNIDYNNPLVRFRGMSSCRICGGLNGSMCFGDEKFIWPEGFLHYIYHGLKPDQEFIDHVMMKKEKENERRRKHQRNY